MHTFEELSRDWVNIMAEMGNLSFLPERTGSFWSKQAQVDVVAPNWRTMDILLDECKWGQGAVGWDVIEALVNKAAKILPGNFSWRVQYFFCATWLCTVAAEALAQTHDARLVTLAEMESDMARWLRWKTTDGD